MSAHNLVAAGGRKRGWGATLLILSVVAYVVLLLVAPIASIVRGALQDGFPALLTALQKPTLWESFGLSVKIAFAVIVIQLLLGSATAWVIVRHNFRGKGLFNAVIDIPFAISPVVVGYMLLLAFGRSGFLYPAVKALDIQVAFAVPGIFLATLFVSLPFMIRELIPVIENLDRVQELAATTMGAGRWTTFWRIIFPPLRTALVYGVALTMARAMGEFGAVLVIGGGVQGRTATTTMYIFHALEERQYVEAYAAAIILAFVSVLIVSFADWIRHRSTAQ